MAVFRDEIGDFFDFVGEWEFTGRESFEGFDSGFFDGGLFAGGANNGIGEFRRRCGAKADDRGVGFLGEGDRHADGGMGVERIAVRLAEFADCGERLRGIGPAGAEPWIEGILSGEGLDFDFTGFCEGFHPRPYLSGIALGVEEEPAFEIGGDLNVHRGGERWNDGAAAVGTRVKETRKDIVFVGCQDEFVDWKAHFGGGIPGKDIAEIAGRHGEGDLFCAGPFHDAESGMEVVDDLCEDTGPVDGVYGTEMESVFEGEIAEETFDDRLCVIESAIEGDIEDIRIEDRRHLHFLHGRDSSGGMQNEDADVFTTAYAVDCGGTGIAGCGDDDIQLAFLFSENVFEQVSEELEGNVLEGVGRTMEEFEKVDGADIANRDDLRIGVAGVVGFGNGAEAFVGFGDDAAKIFIGDIVAEKAHDLEREIGIGEFAPGFQTIGHIRKGFRKKETAVTGEPHQDGILERNIGNLTTGTAVAHRKGEWERVKKVEKGLGQTAVQVQTDGEESQIWKPRCEEGGKVSMLTEELKRKGDTVEDEEDGEGQRNSAEDALAGSGDTGGDCEKGNHDARPRGCQTIPEIDPFFVVSACFAEDSEHIGRAEIHPFPVCQQHIVRGFGKFREREERWDGFFAGLVSGNSGVVFRDEIAIGSQGRKGRIGKPPDAVGVAGGIGANDGGLRLVDFLSNDDICLRIGETGLVGGVDGGESPPPVFGHEEEIFGPFVIGGFELTAFHLIRPCSQSGRQVFGG